MANKTVISLDEAGFDKHVEHSLTPSQRTFASLLKDWLARPRNEIILISGGPGTGKTYVVQTCLSFVRNAIQVRMAYAARIANEIEGRTIHSTMQLDWKPGSVLSGIEKDLENEVDVAKCLERSAELKEVMHCLKKPSIVIVDEIGMIPFWLLYWIIRYFFDKKKPVLFIGMGDWHQLRPVKSAYNMFGVDCLDKEFETYRIELVESKRFYPMYESVIERLKGFVNTGDEEGLIDYVRETFPVVDDIDGSLLARCTMALAYRNDTVNLYNKYYIQKMISGKRTRIREYNFEEEKPIMDSFIEVKPNCKILVTENGNLDVNNGTQLLFKRYDEVRDVLECESLKIPGKIVIIERNKSLHNIRKAKFPITLGFAATIHKFQGFTIDDEAIVINFNSCRDLNLIYTALSRVKTMEQILAITL
ncbi:hypothetical protein AVEN_222901-1 [Araneus ventricosus]|uniref:ATP-dependent DNA helicase PIF1 n=1 Tax=Araneus ventricosus TaxID=182803 RepID=A0A4Y2MNP8_ARAVE|nr:hypothetical protein AVEN_222901-1 [Araneus ventricosus]